MTTLSILAPAVALIAAVTFVAAYMPRWWWQHITGHSVMATMVGVAVLAAAEETRYLGWEWADALVAAAWLHLGLVVGGRVLLLIKDRPPPPPHLPDDPPEE